MRVRDWSILSAYAAPYTASATLRVGLSAAVRCSGPQSSGRRVRTNERAQPFRFQPLAREVVCCVCCVAPEPLEIGSRRNGFVPARLPIDREVRIYIHNKKQFPTKLKRNEIGEINYGKTISLQCLCWYRECSTDCCVLIWDGVNSNRLVGLLSFNCVPSSP